MANKKGPSILDEGSTPTSVGNSERKKVGKTKTTFSLDQDVMEWLVREVAFQQMARGKLVKLSSLVNEMLHAEMVRRMKDRR